MPSDDPLTESDLGDLPKTDRRALYEKLLGIVDEQTSPKQLPWARQVHVRRIACSSTRCRADAVDSLLGDLVERAHCLRWRDREGYQVVCRTDAESLARVHAVLRSRSRERPTLEAWVLDKLEAAAEGGASA